MSRKTRYPINLLHLIRTGGCKEEERTWEDYFQLYTKPEGRLTPKPDT
jgi:hypothetical protein